MFSLFRKNHKKIHPLFGELVYRPNRAANKKQLSGFWQGRLQLVGEEPTSLVIWGDQKSTPHLKHEELFKQIVDGIEQYIMESKEGLLLQVQKEENLNEKPLATLEEIYFQTYPMSERLQQDLDKNLDGVAWGFRFLIDANNEGNLINGYSAYVNLELHPKFPFTYY